jgi:hypothetical protein
LVFCFILFFICIYLGQQNYGFFFNQVWWHMFAVSALGRLRQVQS